MFKPKTNGYFLLKNGVQYLPREYIQLSDRNDARSVLSVDVYGFACIAWKLLRSLMEGSYITDDPFDPEFVHQNGILSVENGIISQTSPKLNSSLIADLQRNDSAGIPFDPQEYQNLVTVIEECWSKQPALRLTGAQLHWRLKKIFKNCSESPYNEEDA